MPPKKSYDLIHILEVLFLLKNEVSRAEICKTLGLGEGVVKAILLELKKRNLASSSKKGHFLSEKGREEMKSLSKNFSWIPRAKIHVPFLEGRYKSVGIVRDPSTFAVHTLRDCAIKRGADAALILKATESSMALPPEEKEWDEFRFLRDDYSLKEGDYLCISFSASLRGAQDGCIAICLLLSQALKSFTSRHFEEEFKRILSHD